MLDLEYCFEEEDKICFVVKYMKGGDFFQHLQKERRFSEAG